MHSTVNNILVEALLTRLAGWQGGGCYAEPGQCGMVVPLPQDFWQPKERMVHKGLQWFNPAIPVHPVNVIVGQAPATLREPPVGWYAMPYSRRNP